MEPKKDLNQILVTGTKQPDRADKLIFLLHIIKWLVILALFGYLAYILIGCNGGPALIETKKKKINVDNYPDYAAGMEHWEHLDYPEAARCLTAALAASEEQEGKDALTSAEIRQKLGALYMDEGRFNDAYECLSQSYVTFRDVLGDSDGNTIVAKGQIANCDIRRGDYERGEKALSELYSETKVIKYLIQFKMMEAECETEKGNYQNAKACYEQVLGFLMAWDTPLQMIVIGLNDYGIMMDSAGYYDEASDLLFQALRQWELLHAENPQEDDLLATIYSNLACNCASRGRNDEAMEYAEKSRAITERLHGDHSFAGVYARTAVAGMYGSMKQYDKQFEELSSLLDMLLDTVGENHAATANTYNLLGNWYRRDGNYEKAAQSHQKALEIRKNLLGLESMRTMDVYIALAEDNREQGEPDAALEYLTEAKEICEKVYSRTNRFYADCCTDSAWVLLDAGKPEDAFAEAKKACDICDMQKSRLTQPRAAAYQVLGAASIHLKQYEDARKYLSRSDQLYSEVNLGDLYTDHIAMNALFEGDICRMEDDLAACRKAYARGYAMSRALYPDEIPETVTKRLKLLYEAEAPEKDYAAWLKDFEKESQHAGITGTESGTAAPADGTGTDAKAAA